MDRILLGFNATPAAWEALDYAAILALATGAEVTVAHVTAFQAPGGEVTEPLELARDALEARGVGVGLANAEGDPAEQLERLAADGAYDAVVVGSPPAGPLERLAAGSVTLHLVCHAPIAVIVARRP